MNEPTTTNAPPATAVLARSGSGDKNYVLDGMFRKPLAAPGEAMQIDAPDDCMGAWQLTRGTAMVYSATLAQTHHQAVDVGGAIISQDLDLPTGAQFEITWSHNRNTDSTCPNVDQRYSAQVLRPNGDTLVSHSYEPDGPDFTPVSQTLKFTADTTPITLQFSGRAPDCCGALITNVVAREVAFP